ncbi:putative Metallophosphoesterase [Monocercomonoides exilis]|uniref:putative Metallophosphoesterase n=1 Tax=Monocercomonoides exilis TaxID=2049356 RepID=UPI00355956A9|nr:putative Metallophosphoesterase [Monocercomonoides exilis]|eukprot:MONOS_12716.1-p1 / transcript=MONOS_12716.1 / gene=MONOS_12716 / organism=Monocercomonoides_exilis_PA203 / gene_product=Metallophosphoesterase / transcript_product=Metallophosphoesterase / location=Mono_scaffold00724:11852-12884(+) / protein_length=263 / sequence_SO=supercontig / SO=protein_coding / is_pseudo=false
MSKVFLISDVHVNYAANWKWLSEISGHENDILLVAGDVSHDISELARCLQMLVAKFKHVFYTPGNHDVWVMDDDKQDSISKMEHVLKICEHAGVKTRPEFLENIWIVPLFSWYDSTFAISEPLTKNDIEELKGWSDLHFCKWPKGFKPRDMYERNEDFIQSFDLMDASPIISFSHMLPRRDLLPPRAELEHKFLAHVVGSTLLESQIKRLGSTVHGFGHSHVNKDVVIDGVRYVQNAMGYPKERERYSYTPRLKQIWPLEEGE